MTNKIERTIDIRGEETRAVGYNGFTEDFAVSVTLYFWSDGRMSHTKYPEWAPCPHDEISRGKGSSPYCVNCGSWVEDD